MRRLVWILLCSLAFGQGIIVSKSTVISKGVALAPGSGFTLVQHAVHACTNANTCTATVSATSAGNVITATLSEYNVFSTANNPVYFSSATDSVGTCTYSFIPSSWQEQNGNGNGYMTNLHAVCLSSSAGATTVSMTTGGTLNSGAISSLEVEEWKPVGGTAGFDAGQTGPFTACTTCASPTLTLSGLADLVIQQINSSATPSAITGSWTYKNFDATYAHSGFATIQSGPGSSFNWTNSSAGGNLVGLSAFAIGLNVTPCSDSMLENWTGGIVGNGPLAADLLTGLFGALAVNFKATEATAWTVTNSGTGVKYASVTPPALNATYRPCVGGATYAGSPTQVLQYNSTIAPPQYVSLFLPNQDFATGSNGFTGNTFTGCQFIYTDFTNANTVLEQDVFSLALNGGNFVNMQIGNGGGTQLQFATEITTGAGSGTNPINFTTATWYQICEGYTTVQQGAGTNTNFANSAANTGWTAVYSSTGTLVGSSIFHAVVGASAQAPLKVNIGSFAASAPPTGHFINFGPTRICVANGTNGICPFPNLM